MAARTESYVDASALIAYADKSNSFHHLFRRAFADLLSLAMTPLVIAEGQGRRFSDQDLTLVDAVGLHVMTERRIKSCWSTDFHLSLTGVNLLIHER